MSMTITPSTLNLDASAQTTTLTLVTDEAPWSISIPYLTTEWAVLDRYQGLTAGTFNIHLSVLQNQSTSRSASIIGTGMTTLCTINQAAPVYRSVTYNYTTGGTVSGPSQVLNGGSITVTVNPDSGYVLDHLEVNVGTVTGTTISNITTDLTVIGVFVLDGTGISASPSSIDAPYYASSNTITITKTGVSGDISYSVPYYTQWLTVRTLGSDQFLISYSTNPSTTSTRSTTVTFSLTYNGREYQTTVDVEQAASEAAIYNLTYNQSTGGTISGPATVTTGESAYVNVVVYEGYLFSRLSISPASGGEVLGNTITNITSDLTVTPTFTPQYTYINVNPTSATYIAAGESKSVTISTNYTGTVTTSPSQSWITVTGSGNTRTVTVSQNSSSDYRTGTVTFTAGTATATYTVTQNGTEDIYITISPNEYTFTSSAGSIPITVTTNYTGTVTATPSANWIRYNGVNVSVDANTTTGTRTAIITFTAGAATAIFTATQGGVTPFLTLSPSTGTIDGAGGSTTATLTTNLTNWGLLPTYSWLTCNPNSGTAGTYTITFTAGANISSESRSNIVKSRIGDTLTGVYTLTQTAPPYLILYPTEVNFPYTASGKAITISTNYSGTLTATSSQSWLTYSSLTSTGVTINAISNPSSSSRTGVITINAGGLSATITVRQAPLTSDNHITSWKDTTYTFDSANVGYSLRKGSNDIIFAGNAVSVTGSNATINVNKIFRDYLYTNFTFPSTSGLIDHPGEDGTFYIYIGDAIEETYKMHYDYSYNNNIYNSNRNLSNPINGHAAYRQYALFTRYDLSSISKDVVVTTGSTPTTYSITFDATPNTQTYAYKIGSGVNSVSIDSNAIQYNSTYCGDGALYYVNTIGGWDSFLIEGNIYKTDKYQKETYSKVFNNSNTTNFGKNNINKEINTSYVLHTGWLTDTESEKLAVNLLGSPHIYYHDLVNDVIYSAYITDTEVEHKKFKNGRQLNRYNINIECSQYKLRK